MTEKVYSKEHEMSENLKYEILNMISTLRSIDAKASCEPFYPEKVDYSNEIKSLEKIQSSPEYLLFLKSINDSDERLLMELRLRLLTLHDFSIMERREWVHMILDTLRDRSDLDGVIDKVSEDYKNNWNQLVKELCEMKSILSVFDAEAWEKAEQDENDLKKAFFEYLWLNEGKNDINVQYWYGLLNNKETLYNNARDSGANQSLRDIINKYKVEYEEFLKSYKDGN